MNYYDIIHKYIPPGSKTYPIYITHVTLVTKKALEIGRKLGLSDEKLQFIEKAGMLHDIGIIKVDDAGIFCTGELPYISHGVEGRKILERENLEKHALVCERHTGVGIYKDEIVQRKLPLPKRDMLAITLEEKIISYADLFFSKDPKKIWYEKKPAEAQATIEKFGIIKEMYWFYVTFFESNSLINFFFRSSFNPRCRRTLSLT